MQNWLEEREWAQPAKRRSQTMRQWVIGANRLVDGAYRASELYVELIGTPPSSNCRPYVPVL